MSGSLIAPAVPQVALGARTADLRGIVEALGAREVLLVASATARKRTKVAEVLVPMPTTAFEGFTTNPKLHEIARLADRLRPFDLGAVVAVGGGSTLDTAKAARALAERKDLPLVLVPTTAGSGSEATSFATVFDGHRKISIVCPPTDDDVVVFDPALLETCPSTVSAGDC